MCCSVETGEPDHVFGAFAVGGEDDVGDRLPAAGDGPAVVELLDARGLAIGVVLAGLGELGFLGRELLDDVVDLRLREIVLVLSAASAAAPITESSRKFQVLCA